MNKPETIVLGKEEVEICGVKIEVRLIETQARDGVTNEWKSIILPRARYLERNALTNQQRIRIKLDDAKQIKKTEKGGKNGTE